MATTRTSMAIWLALALAACGGQKQDHRSSGAAGESPALRLTDDPCDFDWNDPDAAPERPCLADYERLVEDEIASDELDAEGSIEDSESAESAEADDSRASAPQQQSGVQVTLPGYGTQVASGVQVGIGPSVVTATGGPVCVANGAGATGALTVDIPFAGSVNPQLIDSRGWIRQHDLYATASFSGSGRIGVTGTIKGNDKFWSATLSTAGQASAKGHVHLYQILTGVVSRQFPVADIWLSANAAFSDSVTYTQSCDPKSVMVTTQGPSGITVANASLDKFAFYGYLTPRIGGPLVKNVRAAIADWAKKEANAAMSALIGPAVFKANAAYDKQKKDVLDALVKALPPGCGCRILPLVFPVATTPPIAQPVATPTPPANISPECSCRTIDGTCAWRKDGQIISKWSAATNDPSTCDSLCTTYADQVPPICLMATAKDAFQSR